MRQRRNTNKNKKMNEVLLGCFVFMSFLGCALLRACSALVDCLVLVGIPHPGAVLEMEVKVL